MSCCAHANAAGRFFSFFARRYHKRYLKQGLEKTQQQLVAGLDQAGYDKATLLEIGSGVGYLHQHLLKHGADNAIGIDLSQKMLVEAQLLAKAQGLDHQVVYLHGDFLNLVSDIDNAEVTLLDKVVCCYPDESMA
jgi:cyclopropane fatty-acyl-phospholipid synthase-like methyltransferase